jgi:DNA-directed RNA polymerase subunit K/omega
MEYSMKAVNTVERYNIDNCIKPFEGNRFKMILAGAIRAREIASKRTIADKNGNRIKYDNKPTVEALCEIDQGVFGAEYLNKLK